MIERRLFRHSAFLIGALFLCCAAMGEVPSAFAASDMQPYWAWGFTGPATNAPAPPRPATPPPDNKKRHTLPGSRFSFTAAELAFPTEDSKYSPADWYPEDHPQPMPEIVAHGRKSAEIYPCGLCHRPNGSGRPENANITGLPTEYFVRQVMDFKSGARQSSDARKGNVKK